MVVVRREGAYIMRTRTADGDCWYYPERLGPLSTGLNGQSRFGWATVVVYGHSLAQAATDQLGEEHDQEREGAER